MKSRRQKKILELIKNNIVSTQEELADHLRNDGLTVTQATVSRDIKELGLIKVAAGNDVYKYALPKEQMAISEKRLRFMLKEFVIGIEYSENMIVIKTPPGNANAVASVLDGANFKEIIGTIAGDDTILLIVKPKEAVIDLVEQLENILAQ